MANRDYRLRPDVQTFDYAEWPVTLVAPASVSAAAVGRRVEPPDR
jgi:hypothetical protein